jgi:hypothetical protein
MIKPVILQKIKTSVVASIDRLKIGHDYRGCTDPDCHFCAAIRNLVTVLHDLDPENWVGEDITVKGQTHDG